MNKIKKLFLFLCLTTSNAIINACPICDKQQPALLKGITHGTGPQGTMDYIIIICVAIIVLMTLILSVKMLIRPGEKSPHHIKYKILNDGSK